MTVLRIHFTRRDLAGIVVAEDFDPLWESVLSVHRLREREIDTDLTRWSNGCGSQCQRARHGVAQGRPGGQRAVRQLGPAQPHLGGRTAAQRLDVYTVTVLDRPANQGA
ncbi:hypothetical protein [Kutzneria sp. NPDC052558]|uniref:hypothetical protein n=1 Tax=Kutzneria sp. NPDC052558 TaxID=3364121 RepID=UPI0037C7391C